MEEVGGAVVFANVPISAAATAKVVERVRLTVERMLLIERGERVGRERMRAVRREGDRLAQRAERGLQLVGAEGVEVVASKTSTSTKDHGKLLKQNASAKEIVVKVSQATKWNENL